ncbi:MAG: cupin domain-containing protein [Planctomycetia bacterium]
MSSQPTAEVIEEQAALYVAGALPPDERLLFESALAAGDPAHLRALDGVAPALSALADGMELEPPPSILAGLRQRIAAAAPPDPVVVRDADADWIASPYPGVSFKFLGLDPTKRRRSRLVRLDAGADLPEHRHRGLEECYVLTGELHTAGVVLRPGDYLRFDAGTLHSVSHAPAGCLLLVWEDFADPAIL